MPEGSHGENQDNYFDPSIQEGIHGEDLLSQRWERRLIGIFCQDNDVINQNINGDKSTENFKVDDKVPSQTSSTLRREYSTKKNSTL